MNGTWPPASSSPPGVSNPTCKRTTVPSLLVFGKRLKRKSRTEIVPLITPKTVAPVTADIVMLVDGELGGLDLVVDVVAGVSLDGRCCRYLCFGISFAAHLSLCSSMPALQQRRRTPALLDYCSPDWPTTLRPGLCQYERVQHAKVMQDRCILENLRCTKDTGRVSSIANVTSCRSCREVLRRFTLW